MKLIGKQKLRKSEGALDMHYPSQGELGKAESAKKGSGGSVNAALVGAFAPGELTTVSKKKGTGGVVESSLWKMAGDMSLSKDFS